MVLELEVVNKKAEVAICLENEDDMLLLKARAAEMSAFEGTQPVLRQSPPMRCFSM